MTKSHGSYICSRYISLIESHQIRNIFEVLNKYREHTDKLQVKGTDADARFDAGLGFHIKSEKKQSLM